MPSSRSLLSLLLLLLPHATQPRPVFGITAARLEKLSWDEASNQTKARLPAPARPPQPPARPRSSLTSGPSQSFVKCPKTASSSVQVRLPSGQLTRPRGRGSGRLEPRGGSIFAVGLTRHRHRLTC